MKTIFLALFGSLFIAPVFAKNTASSLPNTDIYLAKIAQNKVLSLENITKREGYDNQPNFTGNGLLYTAAFQHGNNWQTDTMLYDFTSKKTINLTNTDVSEYSPTKVPNENGFSVILEGHDASQELWQYALQTEQKAFRLRKEVGKIGYHAWGKNKDLITFVLGEPHSLYFGNIDKQTGAPVAENIGRSLAYNSSLDAYSFSQYKDKEQWVTLFDHKTDSFDAVLPLPQGVDYYAWQGDSHLIYAKGAQIFRWQLGEKQKPTVWLDFSNACSGKITRLKYQTPTNLLAFVCESV